MVAPVIHIKILNTNNTQHKGYKMYDQMIIESTFLTMLSSIKAISLIPHLLLIPPIPSMTIASPTRSSHFQNTLITLLIALPSLQSNHLETISIHPLLMPSSKIHIPQHPSTPLHPSQHDDTSANAPIVQETGKPQTFYGHQMKARDLQTKEYYLFNCCNRIRSCSNDSAYIYSSCQVRFLRLKSKPNKESQLDLGFKAL